MKPTDSTKRLGNKPTLGELNKERVRLIKAGCTTAANELMAHYEEVPEPPSKRQPFLVKGKGALHGDYGGAIPSRVHRGSMYWNGRNTVEDIQITKIYLQERKEQLSHWEKQKLIELELAGAETIVTDTNTCYDLLRVWKALSWRQSRLASLAVRQECWEIRELAVLLGCSERTIKRDRDRIRSVIKDWKVASINILWREHCVDSLAN